jgi:hypothetical protein
LSKKRFIIIITFLAGLYFFLEFAVPGVFPGMGVKGTVSSIDWGSVTYRLYDGTEKTHSDKPVMEPGMAKPEVLEIKKRNSLDQMALSDLSQLRPGDVITVGSDESTSYDERPDVSIGPEVGEPTVRIANDRSVEIGGGRAKIDQNTPLKIERGGARIWHLIRWRSAPVAAGDVIKGTWYNDLHVDFSEIITITADRVLHRSPTDLNGKDREFATFTPDDTLVLGKPIETHRHPTQLGLLTIHRGIATVGGTTTYDVSRFPVSVTPGEEEGKPAIVRVGRRTLYLQPKEGLYKLTSYYHKIGAGEHMEITTKAVAVSKRGVVTDVVPTVLHVDTKQGPKSEVVGRSALVIRTSYIQQRVGTASIPQPREDEAKTTELNVGDEVQVGQTTYLTRLLVPVGDYLLVVGAFGLGLGMFNLLLLHGGAIRKRRANWPFSVVLVAAMFSMTVFAYFRNAPETTLGFRIYNVLFYDMLAPMGSTTFSLLAFYLASAAYRAFKVKTAEAAVMSASAVIVMMGQVPIGIWLTHWNFVPPYLHLEAVCAWILTVAHSAVYRAVMFGATVGAVAMGLRLWLNLERGAFFDQEL